MSFSRSSRAGIYAKCRLTLILSPEEFIQGGGGKLWGTRLQRTDAMAELETKERGNTENSERETTGEHVTWSPLKSLYGSVIST
eukprot:758573-Hanusia_phi.AAC.4